MSPNILSITSCSPIYVPLLYSFVKYSSKVKGIYETNAREKAYSAPYMWNPT